MWYVKIWIHGVWGTKNRHPYLIRDVKLKVIAHIRENAKKKELFIDTIDGHLEHLHCLMALNADISVAKSLQLIKGESAFWMNKEKIIQEKFEWADEYFAVSVGESALDKVRAYINNQEEHHRKVSFAEEYDKFMSAYKFPVQA
jgi:REP element-mobilizing transposase RayT